MYTRIKKWYNKEFQKYLHLSTAGFLKSVRSADSVQRDRQIKYKKRVRIEQCLFINPTVPHLKSYPLFNVYSLPGV